MKDFKYKKQIDKIFPGAGSYTEQWREGRLSFTTFGRDLEFNRLAQLSELLKTKNINIYVADDGSCHGHDPGEYCYCSNASEIEISCSDVEF